MSSAIPPSVTLSSRFFMRMGMTEVMGSTSSTFTSASCSTNARMALSSSRSGSISSSATAMRARWAMRRTVDASTDKAGSLAARNKPVTGIERAVCASNVASRHIALAPESADITPMDARNPSATPTFASRTPLHIGAVGLKVRDLERVARFYNHALGLALLRSGRDSVELGAGGVPLVRLEEQRTATPDDPREAGLYHTAFLMPTRGDLARWILHVARNKVALTGASDHAVSEAFYLDDPEGNGVEVYSDRPAEGWQWTGDDLRITTDPLDVDDILREVPATAEYPGAPGGLRIGHVHLRVGDVMRAEGFYRGGVGLDVTRRRHGASFMSSGRYHHHIAANVWHSVGAKERDPERAGLGWLESGAADGASFDALASRLTKAGLAITATPAGIETCDPWGTRLRIARD